MRVVGLCRPPLPPGNIPGTHLCYRLSPPQDQFGHHKYPYEEILNPEAEVNCSGSSVF